MKKKSIHIYVCCLCLNMVSFSGLIQNFRRASPPLSYAETPRALNPELNLTRFSFSCVLKHFLGQFSLLFLELPIINLYTKRIETEMLFKLSNLNSNLALTLGYLNPALNNSAMAFCSIQCSQCSIWICKVQTSAHKC